MKRLSSLILLLLVAAAAETPAAAQDRCAKPNNNEWLTKNAPFSGSWEPVPQERLIPVERELPEAIGMLSTQSAIELTPGQIARFLGPKTPTRTGLKPYLVRAVFPSLHPFVEAGWRGQRLYVFAGGLGCFAYAKHPVVIYLERKPADIDVSASAAL